VIQKYIEHPLVIDGRKFDIRQWVLIQDYCPPKVWFYKECYVRFCTDEYSLDNIYNRFIHLTNNSVQKYNKKADIEKSIWNMGELVGRVGAGCWSEVQEKIKNIVVWSIKSCEGHVTGRRGSC
jgi:tubulin monoglycylase TTLL3/8